MNKEIQPKPGFTPDGLFAPGNKLAAGHAKPLAGRIQQLKCEMLNACTPEQMRAVVQRHFDLIHSKNEKVAVQALALLYDRLFGKAPQPVDVEVTTSGPALNPADYTDDQLASVLAILDAPQRRQSSPAVIDVEPITPGADLILPEPKAYQRLTADLPPMPTE